MAIQHAIVCCGHCGAKARVTRLTDYEFELDCKCKSLVSWAHANPAPEFEESRQVELFTGSEDA